MNDRAAREGEEILRSERETAKRVALSVLHREDLAEDAVQDAWVAALRSGPEVRHARGWIVGVIRRRALDILRREVRRRRREEKVARPERQPDETRRVEEEEAVERVLSEVRRLDERYRDVVLLRYRDGLSPAAIATRLDLPVETVRTRLKRARRTLRSRLGGSDGDRRRLAGLGLLPRRRSFPGPARLLPWALGAAAALLLLGVALGLSPATGSPAAPERRGTTRTVRLDVLPASGTDGAAGARTSGDPGTPETTPPSGRRSGEGDASAPAGGEGGGTVAAAAPRHRHRLLTLDVFGEPGAEAGAPDRRWHGIAVQKRRDLLPDGTLRYSFAIYFDPPGKEPLDVARFHAGEAEVVAEMSGTLDLRARPAGKGKFEIEVLAYDLDTAPIPLTLPPYSTGRNHLHLDPAAKSRGVADERAGVSSLALRGNLSNDIFSEDRPLPFSLDVETDWRPGQEVFEFRVAAHIDTGRLLGAGTKPPATDASRESPKVR